MKWWYAAFCALFLLPPHATGADDIAGAARELAQKITAWPGRNGSLTAVWVNQSSLNPAEVNKGRAAFDAAAPKAENAGGEIRITVSENQSHYLLVGEAKTPESREVFLTSWKRNTRPARTSTLSLEKRLVWEQDDPILDVAFADDVLLVLSPGKLTWVRGGAPVSVTLGRARINWPRDVRGRIRNTGAGFEARLPGLHCRFTAATTAADCRASNEPWVLESGNREMLLANFEASRNYFDGRVSTQTGQRRTVPQFYSAAAIEERGAPLWLFALVDGRTQIVDAAFDRAGVIPGWGSDIAGTSAPCGAGQQILATRPGDGAEAEAIQAFTLANRAPVPLGPALEMPGPVTALWPSGGSAAVAVVKDLETGKYAAYVITLACGS